MRSLLAIRLIPSSILLAWAVLFLVTSTTVDAQETDPNAVYSASLFADLEYRYVGPSRGGRVTAVTGL